MELFVNGGEQAVTSLVYAPTEAQGISFECEGKTKTMMDVEVHELNL